jgi:hypothetical protein
VQVVSCPKIRLQHFAWNEQYEHRICILIRQDYKTNLPRLKIVMKFAPVGQKKERGREKSHMH